MFESNELRKFSDFGRTLAREAGIGFEEWAEQEAAITLKLWVSGVPAASEAKAVIRGRSRAAGKAKVQRASIGGASVNTGRRGGTPGTVFLRPTPGRGKLKFLGAGSVSDSGVVSWRARHYKGPDWARMLATVENYAKIMPKMVEAGKGAVGLARQSIVQIADSLGIALESVKAGGISGEEISKARRALASDGQPHVNGEGKRENLNGKFSIELIDRYPRITQSGIDSALERVVANRMSFQRTEVDRIMLGAAQKTARANPYVEIVS